MWQEPMVWHVESTHTKPHAACKADMVLISASVVLLSFLSVWEWMFYLLVWLLVGFMACGFHLPSQLVNSAAWEPGSPGLLAQGSLRKGRLRMASSRDYWDWRSLVGPGSLASGCRAIVLVLDFQLSLAPPPGVSSFSFCVTYVMPLRMILETSRPAVIDLPLLCISPVPLLSSHLLCQDIFFPSFKSFRSKFPCIVWTFLYPCIWFTLFILSWKL